MDSILLSIKKLLGIPTDDDVFDSELIIHINSVFTILYQLGVGPEEGFTINDQNGSWNDFLKDEKALELVKSYMYMKVRLMFDPPAGSVLTSMESMIREYEFRLNVFSNFEIQNSEKD